MMDAQKNHRKRRLPTKVQLQAWREYIEAAEALRARLASRLQSEAELSMADYHVLLALSEADGNRLRSSELAERIAWERSRLSHHLGRMEKRGLIRREECAEDSRGADAVLSEAGARSFKVGSIPHLEAVRELFVDALSPEQLEQMRSLTASLRGHLGLDKPSGA